MNRLFKMILTVLTAMLVAGALSACGDGSAATNSGTSVVSPTPSPSQAAATEEVQPSEPATKIYKAVNGDIEIPTQAQTIVVVSRAYLGHLLALGIHPAGAPSDALSNPFLEGLVDGIGDIGAGDISPEKIVELAPDLIITATVDDQSYEQYQKIAPTIQIPWGVYDFRDTLKELGVITGREAEATAWLEQFDRKVEENKAKLAGVIGEDETVAIMEINAKAFYVYGDNYGRGGEVLFKSLGLKAPDIIQKEVIEGEGWGALSLETITDYAADHIVLSVLENAGDNADAILGSAIWKNLPAVKEHRVYEIDAKSFYNSDPISLEKEMDILVEMLLERNS